MKKNYFLVLMLCFASLISCTGSNNSSSQGTSDSIVNTSSSQSNSNITDDSSLSTNQTSSVDSSSEVFTSSSEENLDSSSSENVSSDSSETISSSDSKEDILSSSENVSSSSSQENNTSSSSETISSSTSEEIYSSSSSENVSSDSSETISSSDSKEDSLSSSEDISSSEENSSSSDISSEDIPVDDGEEDATSKMIYAKVDSSWSNVYLYTWIDDKTNLSPWPGTEMQLVDEENNIYGLRVEKKYKKLIINNNAGTQTADMNYFNNVDTYIVNGTIASYGDYENGTLTTLVPDVTYYVKGTMNSWSDNDNFKLTYNSNTDTATYTNVFNVGDLFKIANSNWEMQFNSENTRLCSGLKAATSDQNIEVTTEASYTITIKNFSKSNASCAITVTGQEEVTNVDTYYYIGSQNGWNFTSASPLVYDSSSDSSSYTFTVEESELSSGVTFKIAIEGWSKQFHADNTTLCEGLTDSSNSGDSDIKVTAAGTYTIVIYDLSSNPSCNITKIA